MREDDATPEFLSNGLLTFLVLVRQGHDMGDQLRQTSRILPTHGHHASDDSIFITWWQIRTTDSHACKDQSRIGTVWTDLSEPFL